MSDQAMKCFDALRPALYDVQRIISTAPITDQDRFVLGMYVTSYLLGTTMRLHDIVHPDDAHRPHSEVFQEIIDQIKPGIDAAIRRAAN